MIKFEFNWNRKLAARGEASGEIMRQFHARAHFHRVEFADNRRKQMLADYRAQWVDVRGTGIRAVYESARYRRLCDAAGTYRVAGYLFPQEI